MRQRQLLVERRPRRRGLLLQAGGTPGQWLGSEAQALGLSGEIDRDPYAAALAGQDPTTGTALLNRPEPRTFTDAAGGEPPSPD